MEFEPLSPIVDAENAVRRAQECFRSEPPDRALAVVRELKARFPAEARLYALSGHLLELQGCSAEAEGDYRRALDLAPGAPDITLDLAELLLDDSRTEEGEALATAVAEQFPRSARALGLLGLARARRGELAEAEVAFRSAIDLDPQDAWVTRELCDVLCARGKTDEALGLVNGLLDRDPMDPYNHGYLGGILQEKGLLEDAKSAFRTALWLRRDYAWAAWQLGRILCREGQLDDAALVLRECLQADPREPWTLACLGCVERRMGRADEAEACFRGALALDSRLEAAFHGLFDLLVEKDRHAEARDLLDDYVERGAGIRRGRPVAGGEEGS